MENMSAFEIAVMISISLFCLIFVIAAIYAFVSDTIEFFKKLFGRSFKEKVTSFAFDDLGIGRYKAEVKE